MWQPAVMFHYIATVLDQRGPLHGHIEVKEWTKPALHARLAAIVSLFFFVASLQLMSNRQNQYHLLSGHPTIFGHVAEAAPGQYQFTAAVFGLSAQQRVIHE
jgi:hypothetical protein